MSRIEFVSHEAFSDDEYVKEIVYLLLEGKFRVAYIRKKTAIGQLFWGSISVGIRKNGAKEFYPAFIQDSNFLDKDIKTFLEARRWEGPLAQKAATGYQDQDSLPSFHQEAATATGVFGGDHPRNVVNGVEQEGLPF